MKTILFILFSSLPFINFSVDTEEYYAVFSGKSIQNIDQLITELEQQEHTTTNNAYKGALLAKKADFEDDVSKKIKTFKIGVQLLEIEIKKFPKETEYRFLRLCIQENCPKILNYDKNIKEDVQLITNNFSKQPKSLKTIIANYAKTSKQLDATLLK
ncbi:MAG: hypothetical protein COX70_10050 [Flavobacteriales bacterium CG_4_10_14_0_2_um_filter_32_8]|nr:MAG: hypothetical protein COX70_10050 [Flavobacteriales bacterium CG_4_10_14_0_2_um_filter_32_8]